MRRARLYCSGSCDLRQCDATTDPQVTVQGMPLSGSTVVYYYT